MRSWPLSSEVWVCWVRHMQALVLGETYWTHGSFSKTISLHLCTVYYTDYHTSLSGCGSLWAALEWSSLFFALQNSLTGWLFIFLKMDFSSVLFLPKNIEIELLVVTRRTKIYNNYFLSNYFFFHTLLFVALITGKKKELLCKVNWVTFAWVSTELELLLLNNYIIVLLGLGRVCRGQTEKWKVINQT